MGSLWQDIRYALRMMAKLPGQTAVLALTLAIGIGASTTIFSVVHSIIVRPLPYAQPDRLVRVYTDFRGKGLRLDKFWVSGPEFDDLQRACRSCESVAAWYRGNASLGGGDRPFFTTKPGGSGIGLVLARQIAEAHRGSLVLDDRRDTRGAEAVVTLPLAQPVRPSPAAPAQE